MHTKRIENRTNTRTLKLTNFSILSPMGRASFSRCHFSFPWRSPFFFVLLSLLKVPLLFQSRAQPVPPFLASLTPFDSSPYIGCIARIGQFSFLQRECSR